VTFTLRDATFCSSALTDAFTVELLKWDE